MISVRVPATSANLGPGFDAVGLALSLSMRISLDRAPEPFVEVFGVGADLIPATPEHPAYRAAKFVAEFIGEPDVSFHLIQENSIPPARGLGGSAAALVGGAVAANDLLGRAMAPEDLLNLVCDLDGHPDNAAPALLGGLIIGTLTPEGIKSVRLEPEDLGAAVVVPDFTVSTSAARHALPELVPHKDAVFNVGRSGLLLGALATGRYDLLGVAMQDRLHQPYRAHLIPGLEEVISTALEHGAYGSCLSGSGPTVLAFTPPEKTDRVAAAMREAFTGRGTEAKAWALEVDLAGARVEPPGEVAARLPEPVA
ncbi:thrB: homoserine kinase [Rubrobacter radiotolerans]|uniref:Homoserine kinase n=1 Tax=Rubrobacter radiotolerans TaxID=42256 RepID=A0A023X0E3_RUBRA|nr:homoserine kinase [Rubrobacter radiotolerans]AHY45509.1 thrB: homoserine kinase [Rubrobacter radiotolerans]MDX5892922.1 homoserine kinase [Rubrobacter radiotolerans]SMC02747.1 homoserine kinase [Rubrobacter radiotolerans DSM 5868]